MEDTAASAARYAALLLALLLCIYGAWWGGQALERRYGISVAECDPRSTSPPHSAGLVPGECCASLKGGVPDYGSI
jgi:hypothetical protein